MRERVFKGLIAALGFVHLAMWTQALLPRSEELRPAAVSSDPGQDFRANDRDWDHVNDWFPSLKDLYTMSVVIPESPSRGQLLYRSVEGNRR